MIAVDTNILVYAANRDSDWHGMASSRLADLAEGVAFWAIPWPCIHEFLAVATNPKVQNSPVALAAALRQVEIWMKSPSLRLLGEMAGHWEILKRLLVSGRVAGGKVHDTRIAAICLDHDVTELWTADRDFSRFPELRTRNPLIAA